MKVALAQLNSNDDIKKNLKAIVRLIESAKDEKPEIIFFPENSLYFRLNPSEEIQAILLEHEAFKVLSELSNQTQMSFHLTTAIKETSVQSKDRVSNASVLIQPSLPIEIKYKKIHLFDIALKDQKPIRESDGFSHGQNENIFEFKGFKFGSSICYDVRFAELYLKYAKNEVDVILVPAAFLVKTGMAHWELLLRARAIESQCYVLAPAQSGRHEAVDPAYFRETYGNSLAIGPWGQILAHKNSGVGLIYVQLDKQEIESVRQQIPMKDHRRI